MKIRLKVGISGLAGAHNPGTELEWDDAEALRFIAAGIAEAVVPQAETASFKPPEAAIRQPAKPKPIARSQRNAV